jgi:hypothetical protein
VPDLISQKTPSVRRWRAILSLSVVALPAMVGAGSAQAKTPTSHTQSSLHCKAGYRAVVLKRVREHGRTKVIRACKKVATAPKKATAAPLQTSAVVPDSAPATAPTSDPIDTAPAGPTTTSAPELNALIGTGFSQNPLVPDEVTWHYSVAKTQTVTSEGVTKTEALPVPEGELAFFVDGKLECEIHAVGAITGSACTVDLKQLGAHEVEAIFSNATESSTASRTDLVGKYPTTTSVQVSIEPTAPEYMFIGDNAYGFEQYGFEVGRLRISGTGAPGSSPIFDCEGEGPNCLEPETSIPRSGTTSLPLYAQYRLNTATGREEWHVGFDAYDPALREYGWFWQFPKEAVGTKFFHAVSGGNSTLYEPSSTTVPLDLRGGHYPFYWEAKTGEGSGTVPTTEGTLTKVMTLGTYDKVLGTDGALPLKGELYGTASEMEGCGYYVTVDGKNDGERRTAHGGSTEILGGFTEGNSLPAGPHTIELWATRTNGSGPGNCGITRGYVEAYEKLH